MLHTIGDSQWKYLSLLNECIKIILTVLIGVAASRFRVFDAKVFVPQAVKFVFRICLPLHIMRGIGIVVDFYDDRFSWKYICAFLILRALALVLCFVFLILTSLYNGQKHGIGQVAVYWLNTTWISTIILGVPISKAVFGSEALGIFYGMTAGISSFIFQLPLQLSFLECHLVEKEYLNAERNNPTVCPIDIETPNKTVDHASPSSIEPGSLTEGAQAQIVAVEDASNSSEEVAPLLLWLKFARHRDVWKNIFMKLLSNPIMVGILIGFILSLSTLGPTYLLPANKDDFVPGLGWIFWTCDWFGSMVTPISLFTMGVWMHNQGKNLFQIPWYTAATSMLFKLVIVPMVMIGLAKAMHLGNDAGRAAVLIAALPISMASFSLATNYKIGQALLSESIALGTALMLPTIIVWNIVLDDIGLFPIN